MEIRLHHIDWQLKGFWPWVPLKETSMEIGQKLMGVTDWIPATVPGGVHEDLFQAGLIENPYQNLNSLHCEWVENRWWVYKGSFTPTAPVLNGDRVELVFKGLDYEALIYWNKTLLGEHKGMYHAARFDVTALIESDREIELLVVLKHAPDEMAQIGKTSETFTQKSRFNYKWDFSTRLVNVGIWDEVVLEVGRMAAIKDCHVHTDVELARSKGLVHVAVEVEALNEAFARSGKVAVGLLDPQGKLLNQFTLPFAELHPCMELTFEVDNPELWYPAGYGDQPLYAVNITLLAEDGAVAEKNLLTGIRKLEYVQNEGSPEQALPYTVVINGTKIYIKGVNITPLDHLYGNVGQVRYDWLIHLAKTANINLIRVWGGGIIEKPYFYELCDRHGLLVWQEFIQSSSGIDNEPSKHPGFLQLLRISAIAALRQRRNHVCLTVWSGGNELMSEANKPSTYEDENLAMLKSLVGLYDPQRLFLPTSASGPVQYITEQKGISHDVHGHWKYMNNPYHYELYGNVDHLFHSEFGVDGVSALKSLRKFLSEAHLKPQSMGDSMVWRHHGEWWDTFERDRQLFGKLDSMAMFARCSQWIQAEGLRFILEANRRRAFQNSGSIIWQMNEPWPNVSCTNLVDYYQETKMAYHWVKKAFAVKHVSLAYRKLDYCMAERFAEPVYVHSDCSESYKLLAQVLDGRGNVLHQQLFIGETLANRAVEAGVLSFDVPQVERELFIVKLSWKLLRDEVEHTTEVSNTYYFSTASSLPYAPALNWTGAELVVEPQGAWLRSSLHDAELVRSNSDDAYHSRQHGDVPCAAGTQQAGDVQHAVGTQQAGDVPCAAGTQQAGDVQHAVGTQQAGDVQHAVGTQQAGDVQYAVGAQQAGDVQRAVGARQATELQRNEAERLAWHRGDNPHTAIELWQRTYVIRNVGSEAALHVYAEELSDQYWIVAAGSYETIFPGEQLAISVSCTARQGELFQTCAAADRKAEPVIAFSHFTKQ